MKIRQALTKSRCSPALFAVMGTFWLLSSACTNATPEVTLSLENVSPPTKGGSTEWTITIRDLNSGVAISGECDKRAIDLEYSLDDGQTWMSVSSIPGADADCSDGTFRFTDVNVTSGFSENKAFRRNVKLRAVVTIGKTSASNVTVHYLPPAGPRAPGLRLVVGHLSGGNGQANVSLKVYARGRAQ